MGLKQDFKNKRINDVQTILFKYYPNCSDLKRTWKCSKSIVSSMIDKGYLKEIEDNEKVQ